MIKLFIYVLKYFFSTGEPKPFSWAALASKNTSSSGQISQQSTLPSPPQQKTTAGPGFRQDQGAGPQPQRSQRYGKMLHKSLICIQGPQNG